ncbi:hypothetical protein MKW92_038079 [Papaver armeniacum]|nr:hypothetical protein MKW92_038079 [Papaver armeniacum]
MTNPKATAFPLLLIVSFLSIFLLAIFRFEFFNHLEGCHKGQTVKGLRELKQYLKKFGYAADIKNHTEYENSDQFDDILENEIKTYQLNYHLKATGILDAETVKQMRAPRCGIQDTVNGKLPRVQAIGKLALPHFTDITTLRAVCSSAFARWAEVTHFKFSETVHQADIVIGYHRGDHVIAHAFAPTVGMFHYDAEENWSTNPAPGTFDLESVALHEIGHLLGLHHSTDEPNAVMFPTIQTGTQKRQLYADDIRGIRALYGLNP